MHELEGNELEATLLKAANDVADKTPLDAVGLRASRYAISGLYAIWRSRHIP